MSEQVKGETEYWHSKLTSSPVWKQARVETLEECAMLLDERANHSNLTGADSLRRAAAAIRSLK